MTWISRTWAALILAGAAGSIGPALAQDRSAPLAEALGYVPANPGVDLSSGIEFGHYSGAAVAMLHPPEGLGEVFAGPAGAFLRAVPAALRNEVARYGWEKWPDHVGFAPTDMRASLHVAAPPLRVNILFLQDLSAAWVPVALMSNGYEADFRFDGWDSFARGGGDYQMEITARDTSDPFGGAMGMASRVMIGEGDVIVQSNAWTALATIAAATATGPRMIDRPDIAALVAALDSPEAGTGALIGATIWPAGHGPDVGAAMLLADLSAEGQDSTVIALASPDRDAAVALSQEMAERWRTIPSTVTGQSFAQMAPGAVRIGVTGKGPYVALLRIDAPVAERSGAPVNAALSRMFDAIWRGDTVFLPQAAR